MNLEQPNPQNQASLLLVDDDDVFRQVLGKALRKRGFEVIEASSAEQAIQTACQAIPDSVPEFAVIDLKMGGDSGLQLIADLMALDPNTRIVMLTGYASIATAVEAIKLGATHYLTKPTTADEVVAALFKITGNPQVEPAESPQSIDRLEWEHIQKVLTQQEGNISATARVLKMHRRTLQRKLSKKPTAD